MPIFNAGFGQVGPGEAPRPAPGMLQRTGPIVPLQVEIPAALAAQMQATGAQIPTPVIGMGLIDTGASVSAVDLSVVDRLGIQPIGVVPISHAGGSQLQQTYPARFSFPGTSLPTIDFSALLGANLSGMLLPIPGQLIALLGRDLLKSFVLIYNGSDGRFTLCF